MINLDRISTILKSLWKPILAIGVVLIVVMWVWGLIFNGTLEITVTPSPATLLVDGQGSQISNVSTVSISPGSHTVTIQKDGYVNFTEKIQVGVREKKSLSVVLVKQPKNTVTSSKLSQGFGNLVKFPVLSTDGSKVLYLSDGGATLYQMKLDGTAKQAISSNIFPNPQLIEWSPDRSKVIVEVINYKFQLGTTKSPFYSASDPDSSLVAWVYEVSSRKLTKLGTNFVKPVWSADSKSIFYVPETGNPGIYRSASDGTGSQLLVSTTFDQVNLAASPDGNYLAWYPDPEGLGPNSQIHLLKLADLTQDVATPDGFSTGAKWSPDSKMILYDQALSTDFSTSLAVVDVNTHKINQISGNFTVGNSVWDITGQVVYSFDANSYSIVLTTIASKQASPLISTGQDPVESMIPLSGGNSLLYTASDSLYLLDWK